MSARIEACTWGSSPQWTRHHYLRVSRLAGLILPRDSHFFPAISVHQGLFPIHVFSCGRRILKPHAEPLVHCLSREENMNNKLCLIEFIAQTKVSLIFFFKQLSFMPFKQFLRIPKQNWIGGEGLKEPITFDDPTILMGIGKWLQHELQCNYFAPLD